MIVKNEEHIIHESLTCTLPLIDTYCIVDTGSTDNTVQKILDKLDDAITSSYPALATSSCSPQQLAVQSGYLYVCVAANTWQRVAIATWFSPSEA